MNVYTPLDSSTSAVNRIVNGYSVGITAWRAFSASAPTKQFISLTIYTNYTDKTDIQNMQKMIPPPSTKQAFLCHTKFYTILHNDKR